MEWEKGSGHSHKAFPKEERPEQLEATETGQVTRWYPPYLKVCISPHVRVTLSSSAKVSLAFYDDKVLVTYISQN